MKREEQKQGTINRRDFLKGAAIATSTGILAGCAPKVATQVLGTQESGVTAANNNGEPWYGTAPDIQDSDIKETKETELLICGAGHTGMIAALAAAEQGLKTLVIEKNPTIGTVKTYIGALGTKAQNAAGVKMDRNEIVADVARYGSNHVDQKLIQVWADESGDTVDWLANMLSEYGITHVSEYDTGAGMHGVYKCWPTHTKFIATKEGTADQMGSVAPSVAKKAQALGAEFLFSTPLIKLVRENENSGRVTSAIARDKDGNYIKINASKGILIATGGYADNEQLFNLLNPCAASVTTFKWAQPGNMGDGIKAGIWAGGVKDKHPAAMLFDRGITKVGGKAGIPFASGGFMDIFTMGSQPFLKVNMDGKRYCSESTPYDFSLYPLENEKNGVFCMIWDANYWQHIESFHTMGCSRLVPSTSAPATGEGPGKEAVEAIIQGFLEEGLIQQANTVEELATKLNLPPNNLKATIGRYNQFAGAGKDEDFGKPVTDLLALNTPPFYGATIGGWVLTTMDGLHINTDMQVLDADSNIIEGLYAAGDVAGGFFAHNYPELAVGIACGKSMTFGRHAVLHIAGKK